MLFGVNEHFRHILVSQITFICIALFGVASFHRALADDLSAIEECACLCVIELGGGNAGQVPVFIQPTDETVGYLVVDLGSSAKSGCTEQVQADVIVVQGLLLRLVICGDKILDAAGEAFLCAFAAVAFCDRGAIAVRAGYEDHVVLADPIPKKPGVYICKYEYAANVSKVQRFISIGHATGDHSPLGKLRAGFRLFMKVFFLAHVTSASKRIIYNLV